MTKKKIKAVLNQVPADYYFEGVKTNFLQKYWHGKKWQTLRRLLERTKAGKLLDIGCADGTTTFEIAKSFPQLSITGIDYYEHAIEFALRTYSDIKFRVADAHKLPFEKQSFDLVTAIETLEHLKTPPKALAEIWRVLKPGGFLIVGQDTDSLLFRLVWWLWTMGKGAVWDGSHINCQRPKELIRNLKKSHFTPRKIEYINWRMEVFIKAQKSKK